MQREATIMSSRAVCHFIFSSLQQWYVGIKNFFPRGFCIRAELLIPLLYSEAYTIKVELMVECQYMWLLPSTVSLKCCKHWIRNQWEFPVFMQSLGYSHTKLILWLQYCNWSSVYIYSSRSFRPHDTDDHNIMHVCTYYKHASAWWMCVMAINFTIWNGRYRIWGTQYKQKTLQHYSKLQYRVVSHGL